jgi:hypothetical protein
MSADYDKNSADYDKNSADYDKNSADCPIFDEDKFIEVVGIINNLTNGEFSKQLATCPTEEFILGGGKKMRGGDRRSVLRWGLWLLIAFLFCITMRGSAGPVIGNGIRMIVSGECGYARERLFATVGLGNQVCRFWNAVINTIAQALTGDPVALAQIAAVLTALIAAPTTAINIVENLVDKVLPNNQSKKGGQQTKKGRNGRHRKSRKSNGRKSRKGNGKKSKKYRK